MLSVYLAVVTLAKLPSQSFNLRCVVQDILRPFLMGLESKSPKLASISLVSIQKLCAYGALSDEGISSLATALEQVCCQPNRARDGIILVL